MFHSKLLNNQRVHTHTPILPSNPKHCLWKILLLHIIIYIYVYLYYYYHKTPRYNYFEASMLDYRASHVFFKGHSSHALPGAPGAPKRPAPPVVLPATFAWRGRTSPHKAGRPAAFVAEKKPGSWGEMWWNVVNSSDITIPDITSFMAGHNHPQMVGWLLGLPHDLRRISEVILLLKRSHRYGKCNDFNASSMC